MSKSKPYTVELARKPEPTWMISLFYIYAILAPPYLVWRWQIINWQVWYGPAAFVAEFYGIIMTVTYLWITKRMDLPVHRPATGMQTVDVLVPTYTEPLSVVEPTVIGALRVHGVRRVLVLDDGNRPEIRDMAERLGAKYYARTTNEHAKAGNMNNGLLHTDAQFLLTLDADHIPLPSFVERTLGYFDDDELAFVQTPQTYYNHDSFLFRRRGQGKLWSEQIMFYDAIQPAKNRHNSAFFVGTSALLRRSAIDSVGGFATGTATEDIHTSLRLHAKGWKSLFLPETLAYGLEAESLKEFYKQRRRWSAGSLGLLFRSPDSPLRARGLTFSQRINYVNATLAHLQGAQKLMFYLLPVVSVLFLVPPITTNLAYFNLIFGGFLVLAVGSTIVYARGTYHLLYTEGYGLANMMAHFGGMWGIVKVQKKFVVSNKVAERAERSWLRIMLWLLLASGIVGLARGLYLLNFAHRGSGLVVSALIFIGLNLAFLLTFFAYFLAYERREEAPDYTNLPPLEMYRHIQESFAPIKNPEPVVAQDYRSKIS